MLSVAISINDFLLSRYIGNDNIDLVLTSGHSSNALIDSYRPFNRFEKKVWYHMTTNFLEHKHKPFKYNENLTMVYTGRITHKQKRVFQVLEIFKEYAKTCRNCELVFIGDGPDLEKLRYKCKGNEHVRILGNFPNENLPKVYSQLSSPIFIFPSVSETLGKSPLEASLFGIPVFTGISMETPFLYQDGVNGYTFTTTDECCEKIKLFVNSDRKSKLRVIKNGKKLKSLFGNQTQMIAKVLQSM